MGIYCIGLAVLSIVEPIVAPLRCPILFPIDGLEDGGFDTFDISVVRDGCDVIDVCVS
jgi:hypothetical protein